MWVFLGMETIANIKYRSHVDSDSCLLAVCRWLIPHEVAPQQSFTMLQPANAKVIIKNGTTKNNHIYFILQFDPLKHSINNSSCNLTYTPKIVYNKQNKQQYLTNLSRVFRAASYIKVTFDEVEVMRHPVNANFYGVTLHQGYTSNRYHDDGYLFLLWDFTDEAHPQIHVRTWQPDRVGGKALPKDEIFTLSDFDI